MPVGVTSGAKENRQVGRTAYRCSVDGVESQIDTEEFNSKEPIKSSLSGAIVHGVQSQDSQVVLAYSLFSPEAKAKKGFRRDRIMAMMNGGMQEGSQDGFIDEAGNAYRSTGNSSISIQRKFDASMMRSLQRDLTTKLKESE